MSVAVYTVCLFPSEITANGEDPETITDGLP